VAADQLTKAVGVAALRDGGGWPVTGWFTLVLTYNTGAAFNFLASASGWQRWLLAAIACAAAVFIVALLRRGGSTLYSAGLALILGAPGQSHRSSDAGQGGRLPAVSLRRMGVSAFNVADSAITVGAAFLFDSFRRPRRDSKEAAKGV
jgi:signal peptidase II